MQHESNTCLPYQSSPSVYYHVYGRGFTNEEASYGARGPVFDSSRTSPPYITMPLWSNDEWKARIGSSWCALGRPVKLHHLSSVSYGGGGRSRTVSLRLDLSGGSVFQTVYSVILMAVVTGIDIYNSWIIGCRKVLQGW